MADAQQQARRRRWADVAVILASVYALVSAVRVPPGVMMGEGAEPIESVPWLAAACGAAGALGLAGLAVGSRWARPARAMVALAGILLLGAVLLLEEAAIFSILSLAVPGLALLAAAPFAGGMPSPEEEGRAR